MKVFITSIGESTTELCAKQFKKYGFDVVVLSEDELWPAKYKRFIKLANETKEDVIRVDADIIPNKNIAQLPTLAEIFKNAYAVQFKTLNFLSMDLYPSTPMIYKKTGLHVMATLVDRIKTERPESEMCRFPEVNDFVWTSPVVMGINGFFQKEKDFERQIDHRIARGQVEQYDFPLAEEVYNTFNK